MKKSVLFGVLAFFAVSAMSVQNANAQNTTVKKSAKTEQKATLSTNKAQSASENAKPVVKSSNAQKELKGTEKEAVLKNGKAPKQVQTADKKAKQDVKAAEKKVKNDVKAADKQVKKDVRRTEKMTKAQRDQKVKAANAKKAKDANTDKKVKK